METLLQDLRYAARSLRRMASRWSPCFASGSDRGDTTMFTFINALMLGRSPMPSGW